MKVIILCHKHTNKKMERKVFQKLMFQVRNGEQFLLYDYSQILNLSVSPVVQFLIIIIHREAVGQECSFGIGFVLTVKLVQTYLSKALFNTFYKH